MRSWLILSLVVAIAIGGLTYLYLLYPETNKAGHNSPPEVKLIYPRGGEKLSGIVEIRWSAEDPDGDALSVTIQYTSDPPPFCPTCPPQRWHNITVGLSNSGSFQWDVSSLKDGKYIIRVVVSDGELSSEDRSEWLIIQGSSKS